MIAEAKTILAELQGKLAELSRREIEIAAESQRLSLGALTGDAVAKKTLASLDAEALRLGLEMKHSRDAVEAQKAIVAEAQRAEEMAAVGLNGDKAMKIAASVRERGARMAAALAQFAAEAQALKADLDQAHVLGCTHPNHAQYMSLGERCFKTAAMDTPFRIEHLAPRERNTFDKLGDAFAQRIENWASQFIRREEAA